MIITFDSRWLVPVRIISTAKRSSLFGKWASQGEAIDKEAVPSGWYVYLCYCKSWNEPVNIQRIGSHNSTKLSIIPSPNCRLFICPVDIGKGKFEIIKIMPYMLLDESITGLIETSETDNTETDEFIILRDNLRMEKCMQY